MKCLNCRTGLMSTDLRCPSCGAATPFVRAAAHSLEKRASFDPAAQRRVSSQQFNRSIALLVLGLAAGAGAAWKFSESRSLPARTQHVTSSDLLKIERPEALPNWIDYSSIRTVDTGVEYVKTRSRTVTSKFFLVAVNDRWLLTRVSPDHQGPYFEGKLVAADQTALSKVQSAFPEMAGRLLPYQLDAQTELSAYKQHGSILSIVGAILGVLMFFTGAHGLMTGSPSRRAPVPPLGSAALGLELPAPGPTLAALPEAGPRPRSWFVRAVVTVVWMGVFFFGSAVVIAVVSNLRAGGDPEVAKKLAEEAGKALGVGMFFGSIGLATLLGYKGWLPGTRR